MGQIRDLQDQIHATAREKGWWDDLEDFAERDLLPILFTAKLGLVTTETAEAIEEIRERRIKTWYRSGGKNEGKPEGAGIEMADAVIRLLDLAGAMGIDLEEAILEKIEFNLTRSYRHGNKAV